MMSEFTTGTPMLPTLKPKLAALPGAACNEVNNSPPFTPGAANANLGSVTNSSSTRAGSLLGDTDAVTVLAAQAVFAFTASRARFRICSGVSPASNGTRTAHSARLVPSPDCTVGTRSKAPAASAEPASVAGDGANVGPGLPVSPSTLEGGLFSCGQPSNRPRPTDMPPPNGAVQVAVTAEIRLAG